MKPNIPILTITLHIPLTPDTEVEEVLEAIATTVTDALNEVRGQESDDLPEQVTDEEPATHLSDEALEGYSENTKDDLLVRLGYGPAD
jgi:2',3'-cyclic-nucleotide 2'-phosphodiesterase (5'-nucleotidase family)